MSVRALVLGALFCATALAAHLPIKRDDVSVLSTAQVIAFNPYIGFATAAYCPPAKTINWSCARCDLNPGFVPTASGGDGGLTQYWYVGFDPTTDSIIVGHQGTNTSNFLAILVDADFVLTPLNSTLFPGLPSTILVDNGFAGSHARAAPSVLAAVQAALAKYNTTTVTVVGHSLGAAVALLDGVYLSLHLPPGTSISTIGLGMPRVGNQAWANYVDAHLNVTHVNNKEDPVPILPPMLIGYHHPSGEIHIDDSGAWVSCPGQDNTSPECSKRDLPTALQWNVSDHVGPYNGVTTGCKADA